MKRKFIQGKMRLDEIVAFVEDDVGLERKKYTNT